jgi:hypothetical protein
MRLAEHRCLLPASLHPRLSYPASCSVIARSVGGLSDALPHVVSLHLSWSMEVLAWAGAGCAVMMQWIRVCWSSVMNSLSL